MKIFARGLVLKQRLMLVMHFCFQAHSDEYSFLVYDSFERNMKGNKLLRVLEPNMSEIC